jgi:hypothetical protein
MIITYERGDFVPNSIDGLFGAITVALGIA